MRNKLISVLLLLSVAVGTTAYAISGKRESGSYDAKSVVLYGQGPSGIVAWKVDVNGVVQAH